MNKYSWLEDLLKEKFPNSKIVHQAISYDTELALGVQMADKRSGFVVEGYKCLAEEGRRCGRHDPIYDDNGDLVISGDNIRHEKFSLNNLSEDERMKEVERIISRLKTELE